MRNPDLFNTLRDFLRDATEDVGTRVRVPQDVPTETVPHVTVIRSTMTTEHKRVFAFEWVVSSERDQLKRLESYSRCRKALKADDRFARHFGKLVGVRGHLARFELDDFLETLLTHLWTAQQNFEFRETAAAAAYSKLEDYFYADELTCRAVAPLENFRSDAVRIDLGDGLAVVGLDDQERSALLNEAASVGEILSKDAVGFNEHAVEWRTTERKLILEDPPRQQLESVDADAAALLGSVAAALALFKSGKTGFKYMLVEIPTWDRPAGSFSADHLAPFETFLTGYWLSEAETASFRDFWTRHRELERENRPEWQLAVRRLGSGQLRRTVEDRVIDYMIAFEALLLRDRAELKYKLALRGAYLVADEPEERLRVFRELQTAYDLRSKIAHGSDPDQRVRVGDQSLEVPRFADRVEDLLRAAIRKHSERPRAEKLEAFLKGLDERIVRGATAPDR